MRKLGDARLASLAEQHPIAPIALPRSLDSQRALVLAREVDRGIATAAFIAQCGPRLSTCRIRRREWLEAAAMMMGLREPLHPLPIGA